MAAATIEALETMYNGHIYRSRHESRWAVFFDTLDIRFWYEPQGFKLPNGVCYLPDFFLPQVNFYAEVKPVELTPGELYKCRAVAAGTYKPILLLVGPPDFRTYQACLPCLIGEEPEDYREADVADFLLDIDYHGRRYFHDEHRLYGSTGGGFEKEEDFTPEYRAAVYAARAARFEERRDSIPNHAAASADTNISPVDDQIEIINLLRLEGKLSAGRISVLLKINITRVRLHLHELGLRQVVTRDRNGGYYLTLGAD